MIFALRYGRPASPSGHRRTAERLAVLRSDAMRRSEGILRRAWPLLLGLPGCTPEGKRALADLALALLAIIVAAVVLVVSVELGLAMAVGLAVWRRGAPGLVLLSLSYGVLLIHGMELLGELQIVRTEPASLITRVLSLALTLPAFAVIAGTLGLFTGWRGLSLGGGVLGSILLGMYLSVLLRPVEPKLVKVAGEPAALALGPANVLCLRTTAGAVSCHDGKFGWSAVPGLGGVTALYGGEETFCALGGGQVTCWGRGRSEPTRLPDITDAVEVMSGRGSLWVRTAAGRLLRFGGDQDLDSRPEPGLLPASTEQIVGGLRFWCMREGTQRIACWAFSESLPPLPGALELAATREQVCAILPQRDVLCYQPLAAWSAQRFPPNHCRPGGSDPACGQPARIADLSDAAQLAAGDKHLCARTRAGAVYCWGKSAAVEKVPLPGRARSVHAGENRFCALLEDFRVFCWGTAAGSRPDEVLPSARIAVLP